MTMPDEQATRMAADLTHATRAGNLPAAYQVIARLSVADMEHVALRAGLSIIFSKRPQERRAHLQQQIAQAAREAA